MEISMPESLSSAVSIMPQQSNADGSNMVLPVMDVICYDKNSRQSVNPKFQEIKASIKARRKLPGSLAVTKRPGSQQYMLYMGGNTRLLSVQELWQETHDPVFYEINVTFCEWKSESDILSAHLIENEARADTTFWEKANGLITLKAELEAETGKVLSSRALEEHLRKLGMNFGHSLIQNYLFAFETLAPIGPFLCGDDLRVLRPRINGHRQLAHQLNLAPDFYPNQLSTVLALYAADLSNGTLFNTTSLCNLLDEKLALAVGESSTELHLMMSALAINPTLTGDALRAAGKNTSETGSISADVSTLHHVTTHKSTTAAASNKKHHPIVLPPSQKNIDQRVRELVTQLCDVTRTEDCLRFVADLPLGFYMELPAELIDAAEVPDIHIRRSSWQMLATLAGQFDQRTAKRLPDESRWRKVMQLDALNEKSFESEYTFLVQGICSEAGAPGTTSEDITYFFCHAETTPLFIELLALTHTWRKTEPHRFLLPTTQV